MGEQRLPKRTRAHELETLSRQHVESIFPAKWLCRQVEGDYGIDLRVEIVAGEDVSGLEFAVQLKGTDHLKISGDDVLHSCKVTTANYFFQRPEPVMYVVYDTQEDTAYWLWVKPYLKGLDEMRPGWRERETVQIRVPRLNHLTPASVEEIAGYVQAWWAEVVPRVGEAVGSALLHPGELPEPGRLPAGSRMAFARNALFTGRVEPLKALARALLEGDGRSALVTQAVAGMGGVGKTQLAVEFAYRYGRFFHGVHWVNAGEPEAIGAEVAACGEAMGLPDWPEKQPEQVARTLSEWQRGGRRLVVLDNLEEVEAAREWLGRLGGGPLCVLVTARRADWPRDLGILPLRLEVFAPEESRAFLRRYLPSPSQEPVLSKAKEEGPGVRVGATDADLDALAERLYHLPLALELAGRYLAQPRRLSIRGYLERMEKVWEHPSMAGWRADLGNPTGHELSLAATFAVSWQRVRDETARRLFLLAGYCAANQPIPCELLEQAAGIEREAGDESLGMLTELGLLEMGDAEAGPTIHPLLAEYARTIAPLSPGGERVGVRGDLPALADALARLARAANERMDQTGSPSHCVLLLPHVRLVAERGEKAGLEEAASLWNSLGYYLSVVADYAGARAVFERALAIDERAFGPDHPNVARDINNLGHVLQDLGDLAGARAAFERALAIWQAAYGDEHPQVATAHNNLGLVLKDLGDLAGARAACERALAIDERAFGPDHPSVAIRVNNLGSVLRELGDLAGARAAHERALAIDERAFGPEHPQVAIFVNNLGLVLHDLGELAGARAAYERALAINERAFGPDHPEVATDVNNLGGVLQALGDLAGARAAFERALRI